MLASIVFKEKAARWRSLIARDETLVTVDFESGYLPSLPFDLLKIDRSFVMNLDKVPESESMIRTLIALSQNIGLITIVEGVETEEQLELVRALGADEVQGYLKGGPTPDPVEVFLRSLSEANVTIPQVLR